MEMTVAKGFCRKRTAPKQMQMLLSCVQVAAELLSGQRKAGVRQRISCASCRAYTGVWLITKIKSASLGQQAGGVQQDVVLNTP